MSEIRPHEFLPDGEVSEWDGTPACAACPLPRRHAAHEPPLPGLEALDEERRRLGEHED